MSKLDKKYILEALKRGIEEEMLQEKEDPKGLAKITKGKGGATGTGYSKESEDLLGVEQIIQNLITGTELKRSKTGEYEGMNKDFEMIRRSFSLTPSGKTITDSDDLLERFKVFFDVGQRVQQQACSNLQQGLAKVLLKTAFTSILTNYNPSTGGFVGERFVSGLLGGTSVATNSGTIADIIVGDTGISLKIKEKGTSGSTMDLLRTLGIVVKQRVPNPNYVDSVPESDTNPQYILEVDSRANTTVPIHSGGLYYLFVRKQVSKKDDTGAAAEKKYVGANFIAMKITRENLLAEIVKNFKSQIRNKTLAVDTSNYEIHYLRSSGVSRRSNIESKIRSNSVLGITGALKNPTAVKNKWGVGDFKEAAYNAVVFSSRQDQTSNNDFKDQNEEIYESLIGLNAFMISIKKKLLQYSLNPTLENLNTLIKELKVSVDFFGDNIDKC